MPHTSSTSTGHVNATLSTTDALVGSFQRLGLYSPSTWGSAIFIPNAETTNSHIMMADNEATISYFIENIGPGDVVLETLHFRLQRDNVSGGSADQVTIALASGDLSTSGPGIQPLSSSGGGQNYDFDLTSILTDATLAPGESATFTFNITPSNPLGTNRRVRVDNMAISGTIAAFSYSNWINQSFSQLFTDNASTANQDGDLLTNLQEFAFGMDPTDPTTQALSYTNGGSITQTGTPITELDGSNHMAVFIRRKDHASAGIVYTLEFSADLELWTTDNTPPTQVTGNNFDQYEAVSVPYPA